MTSVHNSTIAVYRQLRKNFDGDDPYVDGGHGVRGGGRTSYRTRVSNTPAWVNDDEEVRQLLLKVFPQLESDPVQRQRAGVWMTIIHLYFRLGYTRTHVAMVTQWTFDRVEATIRNIRRAFKGVMTKNGSRRRGITPVGRPRINRCPTTSIL